LGIRYNHALDMKKPGEMRGLGGDGGVEGARGAVWTGWGDALDLGGRAESWMVFPENRRLGKSPSPDGGKMGFRVGKRARFAEYDVNVMGLAGKLRFGLWRWFNGDLGHDRFKSDHAPSFL
jgi:hypothetical protein